MLFQTISNTNVECPVWFSEGKTTLPPKPREFTSYNQRPITCVNTLYKWKTNTGEQIDTGLMHTPFVKEPAGELNKFSRLEENPSYKSELKLVKSMKVSCALDLLVQLLAQKCRAAQCQLPCTVDFT